MDYRVEVDFAPMYECLSSTIAFFHKQNHTSMDSGKEWVRRVQADFAPSLLQRMNEVVKVTEDFALSPFIWRCPGERTVSSFLDWFDGLSSGDLYELTASFGSPVPPNLTEMRDRASDMLREWDNGYFRSIDPAILQGLEQEAEARRALVEQAAPLEAVEDATQGMRFYSTGRMKLVVLTPQYHTRPLVTSAIYDEYAFINYSCDVLPPANGRPEAPLLRLTRALSDETRLYILRLLSGRQLSFTEIVKEVGLSKSTIHYHLIALRAAGLIIVHSGEKASASYSLRPEALKVLTERIGAYLKP
ncbi:MULTISPECIES: ArsR/SmtB family transcription factor [Paenibacillus]|nr:MULTISPECIES: winged helix-turn-helix domain-containing protein [Paenibacillus]